jgi:hypothetical protein
LRARLRGGGRRRGGPWHDSGQLRAAGNGPHPSGVGGAVAARIGEGGGTGVRRGPVAVAGVQEKERERGGAVVGH